jgi:hypothetical protein
MGLPVSRGSEQEVYVVPGFVTEQFWHGDCYLIMRRGSRRVKVKAFMQSWQPADDKDAVHFIVHSIDIANARVMPDLEEDIIRG